MDKWFSYDPDGDGFETHKTEQEAKESAEIAISWYRENSSEGWDENVEGVCYGRIHQAVQMVDKRPLPESSEFDYTCNYRLAEVVE